MTLRSRLFAPILLATLCVAQEAQGQPNTASSGRPQPPVVTLSFPGGTLAELVAALRRVEPKANIVFANDAAGAKVPAMELKQAGLDQVLDSACAIAESEHRIQCAEQRGVGEPVFAIVARGPQTTAGVHGPDPDRVTTVVLSLNRLTGGVPVAGVKGLEVRTVLSAIEAGHTFDDEPPFMRFHEDSGLLFLRGTERQLGLATDILRTLERDLQDRARTGGGQPQMPSGTVESGRDR